MGAINTRFSGFYQTKKPIDAIDIYRVRSLILNLGVKIKVLTLGIYWVLLLNSGPWFGSRLEAGMTMELGLSKCRC